MDETFSDALYRDGRDLLQAARDGRLDSVWYRDAEVHQVVDLLCRGRSVLLVGPDGVGKTAVIRGVAYALAARQKPGLVQISTTGMLAGTRYLGEWQSKVTQMARRAASDGVVLYVTDAWNLPQAGVTVQSNSNLLDALRPFLESGQVAVLAEVSAENLRRMETVPGFLDLFQRIRVEPLSEALVDEALGRSAEELEVEVDAASRQALVHLSSRFLPKRPQPAPALGLLERVADYHAQKVEIGEHESIDPEFVEKVVSIYTGLPPFVVGSRVTRRAVEIRDWFSERIVGQEEAIDAVVETIALFKAGLHDPNRPIGTLLFVGPTGVGKTEVARALATFLFGSPHRLLRFDLSEFKDFHAVEALLGSTSNPNQPARLLDPVRVQPFQVVLFDEIEKAHPNVWDVLLPLLDEGRMSGPDGRPADFRNTIVVATSNAGSREADNALGFGAAETRAAERQRGALEQHFRPEFLNRFQHIVAFRRLGDEEMRKVARQELARILSREGITGRHLVVDVDDRALDVVISRGVDRKYGARALKRELQRQIVLPVALHLMEHEVHPGQIVKVATDDGRLRIRLLETDASRSHRREQEPVRLEGRRVGKADLQRAMLDVRSSIDEIAVGVDEPFLREERDRLLELRSTHTFWDDSDFAARALRDLDRATMVIDRLDRLRQRADDLEEQVGGIATRADTERVAGNVSSLEGAIEGAWRELVCMGSDASWDALVEVAPLGVGGRRARDYVVEIYTAWAASRRMTIDWLRVPLTDEEPVLFAVKGRFAHGLVKLEAGLHRLRAGDAHSVARVRVAPWTDRVVPVAFGVHRAMKGAGPFGQRVRSRLECAGGLVLQNGRTLSENRDVAVEIAGPWADAPPPSDVIVRRYDLDEPLVRDLFTGTTSGRPDAMAPDRFHALLLQRIDDAASEEPETA